MPRSTREVDRFARFTLNKAYTDEVTAVIAEGRRSINDLIEEALDRSTAPASPKTPVRSRRRR